MLCHKLVSGRTVKTVRRAGGKVFVWTVGEPGRIRELGRLGVGGVTTNYPSCLHRSPDSAEPPERFVLAGGSFSLASTIDQDKLARYGEKYFEITSRGLAVKTIRDKGLFAALKLARKKWR